MQGGDEKVVIKKFVFIFGMLFVLGFLGNVFALNGIKVPVDLDDEAPVLVAFDYSIIHKKVTFNFEVQEDNFKEIYYRDFAECNRKYIRYNTLCRRLFSSGECFAVRDFCVGEHHMQITVLDKAGNMFRTNSFDFSIV